MRGKECRPINGRDGSKVGGQGKAGKTSSEGGPIFRDHEADGGDRKHVVQWLDWGSAEGATNATNCVVLGDLKGLDDALRRVVRPEWEAVEEDRECYGVKDAAPVVELEAPNGVAQEREALEGRTSSGGYNGGMCFPPKVLINENPEVADVRRPSNLQSPAAGNLEVQRRKSGANQVRAGETTLECNEFRLVGVDFQAIA